MLLLGLFPAAKIIVLWRGKIFALLLIRSGQVLITYMVKELDLWAV